MIRARFRVVLPPDVWVGTVSRAHPEATFRLLTGVPKGDRSLELGEIRAADPEAVVETLREHPDVRNFERLLAAEGRAIGQYEAVEQRLYEFLWESSLPPEFPIVVADGEMEFDLTATQEQFDAFGGFLNASDLEYDLLAAVHTADSERLLTPRQRECLTAALRRGYFEVPRETTLAAVAEDLGVDKSTASETIRRGTARLVEQRLVTEYGPPG